MQSEAPLHNGVSGVEITALKSVAAGGKKKKEDKAEKYQSRLTGRDRAITTVPQSAKYAHADGFGA